jgi:hypothetical protein
MATALGNPYVTTLPLDIGIDRPLGQYDCTSIRSRRWPVKENFEPIGLGMAAKDVSGISSGHVSRNRADGVALLSQPNTFRVRINISAKSDPIRLKANLGLEGCIFFSNIPILTTLPSLYLSHSATPTTLTMAMTWRDSP